ncbi:MAG: hypothetical protein AAF631_10870 [Pseudomonadota bacterium]
MIRMTAFGALLLGVAACTPPASQSNHQNLSVEDCRRIAQEVFASGGLSYNLCPGYKPTGEKIEFR